MITKLIAIILGGLLPIAAAIACVGYVRRSVRGNWANAALVVLGAVPTLLGTVIIVSATIMPNAMPSLVAYLFLAVPMILAIIVFLWRSTTGKSPVQSDAGITR